MKVTQLYSILNTITKEAFGEVAPTVKNGSDFVSLGDYVLNSSSSDCKDTWTRALTDVIGRTIVMNRSYVAKRFPFYKDQMEYGAAVRRIRQYSNEVESNPEWMLSTDGEYNSRSQFDRHDATVLESIYSNQGTWSKTISIPDTQLKKAFQNAEEMAAFYASYYTLMENTMERAKESLSRMALATFIAEKLDYVSDETSGKLHSINILKMYNSEFGTALKAANCYKDKDFLKYLACTVSLYKTRVSTMTTQFSVGTCPVFCPESEIDTYVLKDISAGFGAYLESDTFHNELVKFPEGYIEVPYWQAPGKIYSTSETSRVNMKLASDSAKTINKNNVLCVITSREAICTYFEEDKVATVREELKGYTNQIYKAAIGQFVDLIEPGIVFYAEDVTE